MAWLSRLWNTLRSRSLQDELDEELHFHLELRTRELEHSGWSPQEARTAAAQQFGNTTLQTERMRMMDIALWLETFLNDLRYALRQFRRNPGFTIVVVLTLALGIGANTAIFSVVHAVIVRPLPYPDSDHLVMIALRDPSIGVEHGGYGVADFLTLRQQQSSFESVAAFSSPNNGFTLTGQRAPEEIHGTAVTASFFDVLGAKAQMGRTFLTGEDQAGQPPAVVISDRFWRDHLGADPSAIGRTITLNATNHTVVGVLPTNFHFGLQDNNELWPILQLRTTTQRPPYFLRVAARLKQGVSAAAARADASRIAATVNAQYPSSDKVSAVVTPMKETLVGGSRTALLVILVAVWLVLLIAVVNVASLQIVRSMARRREMAIRASLGAGRWRLVRQLLTESVLLAAVGGALGLAIAYFSLHMVIALNAGVVPRMGEISVDGPVLLYTLGIAMAAGVIFGLAPAYRIHAVRIDDSLKQSGRGTADSSAPGPLNNLLVISEFSLAFILLIGAGLLTRSLLKLESVSPGFNPDKIVTMRVPLPPAQYMKASQVNSFYQQLLDHVKSMPTVQAAGITMSLPPDRLQVSNPFHMEGQSYEPGKSTYLAEEIPVSQDYFRALALPLLSGRFFDDGDQAPDRRVLVINRTMAQRYFAGKEAVGQRVQTGDADPKADWYTIVGVVGDVKYEGLDAGEQPTMYVPYTDSGWNPWFVRSMSLVVRTAANPDEIVSAVRAGVARLDPSVPVTNVLTMDQLLSRSVSGPRFRTGLLCTFAILALILTAIGIYSVLSFSVARRTHEIGVRVALGARRGQVLQLVARQGIRLVLVGLVLGSAGAFALTRLMASLLFSVKATDSATFIGVAIVLTIVAIMACYVPARRAMGVDPLVALRYE